MNQELARELFGQQRVARLATVDAGGAPHLVPVTFALIPSVGDLRELIVVAVDHKPKSTTALRRLDNIAGEPRVAVLADRYDDDWEQLWWVRADAVAELIHGAPRERALAALQAKYHQYQRVPPTGVVIGARVTRWSGWRAAPA